MNALARRAAETRIAAERAELILARQPGVTRAEWTARIMALPPQYRARAVSALFDRAYVWLRLAAKYREPQS